MSDVNNTWSWNDYEQLRTKYAVMGIAVHPDIDSKESQQILNKAIRMNLAYNLPFTDEERQLAKRYGNVLNGALQFVLPHRSPIEIKELLKCADKE